MINQTSRSVRRWVGFFSLGVLIFSGAELRFADAATPPDAFRELRGTYRGSERIAIDRRGRRTLLSAPVKAQVRLSRGKRTLQMKVEGNFIRNNQRGTITSNYTFAQNGRSVMTLRDSLNGETVRAKGTANLRGQGGPFTLIGKGYGLTGVSRGKLRLRGRSLKIRQTLRDGTDTVKFTIRLTKRRNK